MGCVNSSLPRLKNFRWEDIVVEVPEEIITGFHLTDYLRQLNVAELTNRRSSLLEARRQMFYDWSGRTCDAFCALLNTLCSGMSK